MAEKFFDVCGVQIERGDVVEQVTVPQIVGTQRRPSGRVGQRITVDRVQRSAWDPASVYVGGGGSFGHGTWRVVGWVEQPRDVKAAVVEVGHLCGTATTEPVRPHLHDDLTMGPRWSCGPCLAAVPPTGPRHARLLETGRSRSDVPNDVHTRRRDDSNPKDAIGSSKVPCCTVPATVTAEDGLAMLEGALKYGRHNYRAAPVRASVYVDAARRHIDAWFDAGQNDDPDSGLSHLIKARACFGIIRDAQICGTLIDDRPPPAPIEHFAACNAHAKRLTEKYPSPVAPYVAGDARLRSDA